MSATREYMAPYASAVKSEASPRVPFAVFQRPGDLSPAVADPSITAIAVSALVMAEQHGTQLDACQPGNEFARLDAAYHCELSEHLVLWLKYLARTQQADGGWCRATASSATASCVDESLSVMAAFSLCGVPACYGDVGAGLQEFLAKQGGLDILSRCSDRTTILRRLELAHLAVANRVSWHCVGARPLDQLIEQTKALAESSDTVARSQAAAWLAAGVAQSRTGGSRNPLRRWRDLRLVPKALAAIESLQSPSGSFANLVRPTAQVVMLLAAAREAHSGIVRRGVSFLLHAANGDGSWPAECVPPRLPRRAK